MESSEKFAVLLCLWCGPHKIKLLRVYFGALFMLYKENVDFLAIFDNAFCVYVRGTVCVMLGEPAMPNRMKKILLILKFEYLK